MPYGNSSDPSYYAGAAQCQCGGSQKPQGCTLAPPKPFVPACRPAPFHSTVCGGGSQYFKMAHAYGF